LNDPSGGVALPCAIASYPGYADLLVSYGSCLSTWIYPVASHDFNGDGYSDILWRGSNGDVAAWLMNGSTILGSATLGNVPSTWLIIGQRDYNGDGYADLLWRDNSGNLGIWFMAGTQVASTANLGNVPAIGPSTAPPTTTATARPIFSGATA